MNYIIGLLVASMLVLGQTLWKMGVENQPLFKDGFSLPRIFQLFLNPWIFAGLVVYAFATLAYLWMLNKYDYSVVQSLVIPISLILAFVISSVVFKEHIRFINLVGLALIIFGVLLAVRR